MYDLGFVEQALILLSIFFVINPAINLAVSEYKKKAQELKEDESKEFSKTAILDIVKEAGDQHICSHGLFMLLIDLSNVHGFLFTKKIYEEALQELLTGERKLIAKHLKHERKRVCMSLQAKSQSDEICHCLIRLNTSKDVVLYPGEREDYNA